MDLSEFMDAQIKVVNAQIKVVNRQIKVVNAQIKADNPQINYVFFDYAASEETKSWEIRLDEQLISAFLKDISELVHFISGNYLLSANQFFHK